MKYLPAQLKSVGELSIPEGCVLKTLISDDGSTDGTTELLAEYSRSNLNCEYFASPSAHPRGPANNFYYLLSKAIELKADYICFADQDDIWLPNKLLTSFATISHNTQPSIYLGSAITVNSQLVDIGRIPKVGTRTSLPSLLLSNQRAGMTILVNKSAANILLSNISTEIVMHDWWFQLVLIASGARIFEDDEAYVLYRQHDANVMGISHNYLGKILHSMKRGSELFEMRSVQSNSLRKTGLLQDDHYPKLVANLIQPLSISLPSLFSIVMSREFFKNRTKFHKLEARILLMISYFLYHLRKRSD